MGRIEVDPGALRAAGAACTGLARELEHASGVVSRIQHAAAATTCDSALVMFVAAWEAGVPLTVSALNGLGKQAVAAASHYVATDRAAVPRKHG